MYLKFMEIRRNIELDDKEFEKEFLEDRGAPVATKEEFEELKRSYEKWSNEGNNPQEYAYHHDVDLTDLFALEQLLFGSPAPQPLDEMENY